MSRYRQRGDALFRCEVCGLGIVLWAGGYLVSVVRPADAAVSGREPTTKRVCGARCASAAASNEVRRLEAGVEAGRDNREESR